MSGPVPLEGEAEATSHQMGNSLASTPSTQECPSWLVGGALGSEAGHCDPKAEQDKTPPFPGTTVLTPGSESPGPKDMGGGA